MLTNKNSIVRLIVDDLQVLGRHWLLRNLINKDRRFTVRNLSSELNISKNTVCRILKHDLQMKKVSARWVPKLLSDDQKAQCVSCSEEFMDRYEAEGDAFLDRIVTQDETWLWHYQSSR